MTHEKASSGGTGASSCANLVRALTNQHLLMPHGEGKENIESCRRRTYVAFSPVVGLADLVNHREVGA